MRKSDFAILLVLLASGCTQTGMMTAPAELATPEATVNSFFVSWDNEDWSGMYETFSDKFKVNEPTAKSLNDFEKFIKSQTVTGVTVKDVKEVFNNGTHAKVSFVVAYNISGTIAEAESDFELRYKTRDRTPGWKLIQPYGNNADL